MKHTKHLRRVAEQRSVGVPYCLYVPGPNDNAELSPSCTKGVYKRLRREEPTFTYVLKLPDGSWLGGYSLDGPKFVTSVKEAKKFRDFSSAIREKRADHRLSDAQAEIVS